MKPLTFCALALATAGLLGCRENPKQAEMPDNMHQPVYLEAGSLEVLSEGFNELIAEDARLEVLAENHEWTEGPLWIEDGNFLLYSDIPENTVYRWSEDGGVHQYLKPSGFTGTDFKGAEPGSNGLLLDPEGQLVLCQHGDRRVVRMSAPLAEPAAVFETLAAAYEGKRLNSPNDAVYHSSGALYFTDPPYGLPGQMEDPEKELNFQGVYRRMPDGAVKLLTDELSRPNGIAFSPDESTLYVANSDPERAIWMAYEVQEDGQLGPGRVFHDATPRTATEKGLPDGLKVHSSGVLFATGPGGIFVFGADGEVLGRILTGQATANCAFNKDQSMLYITADAYLLRLPLKK